MDEVIKEYGAENDFTKVDIAKAVELATKLGKAVDGFDINHFFIVLDALGGFPSRDNQMSTVYEMASAAHRVMTREWIDKGLTN